MQDKTHEVTLQVTEKTYYCKTIDMTEKEYLNLLGMNDEEIFDNYINRLSDWVDADSPECWDISLKVWDNNVV